MKKNILVSWILMIGMPGFSQHNDSITINASNISINALRSGTSRYLVYYKMGEGSSRKLYELWSRTISFVTYNGKAAIKVAQEWESNDTIFHTASSILDKKTFSTLYHQSWWKRNGRTVNSSFDFTTKEALKNGSTLKDQKDSASVGQWHAFERANTQYFLNWHLDLETFPLFPFKDAAVFKVNFYDPGFGEPRFVAYTVIGSAMLTGFDDQKIDCWLLVHGSLPKNREVFWVSKKTREVLKLEQEFNGNFRYKLKLGFNE
ncbi:MAG: hypothetical protein H7Y86_08470 [Rhizobacter sp.]|nr:hypothetical protein [Ferruginibacter sp.]